jgi:hypothetical protein
LAVLEASGGFGLLLDQAVHRWGEEGGVASEGDGAAALRGAVDVVRLEGGDAGDLGAVEQDECVVRPHVGGQVGVADASGEQGDLLVLVDEVRRFAVAPSGDGRLAKRPQLLPYEGSMG